MLLGFTWVALSMFTIASIVMSPALVHDRYQERLADTLTVSAALLSTVIGCVILLDSAI
jgi:hypothetical protein